MADKSRLGRGLKSLLSVQTPTKASLEESTPSTLVRSVGDTAGAEAMKNGERLVSLLLTRIVPNPHQPRLTMASEALDELAASIRLSGVLQPIIVMASPEQGQGEPTYQLIAGHRRVEAAKKAGLKEIAAILRSSVTEENQAEWALIENIQRQDLNPLERAKAYKSYIDTFVLTQAQAAEKLGEDRATIANFLRMLELDGRVQEMVGRGALSAGHAKVLAGVRDPGRQNTLAAKVLEDGLSVRRLEALVNAVETPAGPVQETPVAAHTRTLAAKSVHIAELEEDLSRKLGTRLRILPSKKRNTGKLVIHYYSLDEFDRVVEKFQ